MAFQVDAMRLKMELVRHRVTAERLARCTGINPVYLREILAGNAPVGELSLRRLWDGLAALGLAEVAETTLSPVPTPTVTGKAVADG